MADVWCLDNQNRASITSSSLRCMSNEYCSRSEDILAGDQCLQNQKAVEIFPSVDARKKAKKFQVELGTPPRGDRSMVTRLQLV